MVVIKECKCDHEFQDKTYGKKMRVFNEGMKDIKCSVCGAKLNSIKKR